jgi:hypothetical protein
MIMLLDYREEETSRMSWLGIRIQTAAIKSVAPDAMRMYKALFIIKWGYIDRLGKAPRQQRLRVLDQNALLVIGDNSH